jgi:flagellar L-ring protein precursor FlgH
MDIESSASGDYGDAGGSAEFDFSSESERAFDGAASFRSQRDFTTRMTASVVDVLPNGNLVISGRKNVVVAGDERILIVSGIVRPYDVSPDNTVQSRYIADFRIDYEGIGQEQAFTRQGFFGRFMNKVWPF